MTAAWLLIAALAAPASAALAGPPETRWNLLDLLPRGTDEAPVPADPAGRLAAAEAAAREGRPERAVFLFRLYIEACLPETACAADLDRARLGLGLALAKLALPEDRDDSAVKEAVRWLESVQDQARRERAEPERRRMRVLLAKKHLFTAGYYARRAAWDAASARLETYAAQYPDAGADQGVRGYLAGLRDAGHAGLAARAERLLAAEVPPAPVRTGGGSLDTASLREVAFAAASGGGAAFDGAGGAKAPLSVSVELQDGQPRALSVASGAWQLSVGQLGIDSRSPLMTESPYVNIRRVTRSALESGIDRRVELQAGVIDMTARFFGDDAPSSAGRLAELARRLGVPEDSLGPLRSGVAGADRWKSEAGVLAGALAQFGRAARLPLPLPAAVDLAWSVTALVKTAAIAPNLAGNATGAVRVTLPSGQEVALMGGWTEDLSPIENSLLSDLARGQGPKVGFYRDGAPQVTAAIGSPLPGLPQVHLELGASRRWAASVVEQKVQAGLSGAVSGKPVELKMGFRDESGPSIEYGRRGASVEASLTFSPGASIYAFCEKEKISYGGVDISNDGCLSGLRWTPGVGAVATVETLFGGKDAVAGAGTAQAAALAAAVGRLGAAGLEAADRIKAKTEPWEGLSAAASVLAALPPAEVAAALDVLAASPLSSQAKGVIAGLILKAMDPGDAGSAEVRRLVSERLGPASDLDQVYAAKRVLAVEAIGVLSDPGFWDGAAQSVVRAGFLSAISELKISLGPLGALRITPASTILMASAVRYHSAPLSPVTAQDAAALQQNVMGALAGAVGAGGKDADAVVGALIDRARDAFARSLESGLIPRLTPLLDDRVALADQALAGLPPDTAARLRARLGPDLGLANLDSASVQAVLRALPEQAAADLRANVAPAAAEALTQALALAAQTVRREINRTVLQLMLASEELDRLTVDRGLKPGDLGARMIAESFARLDERRRRGLRAARGGSIGRVKAALEEQAKELAALSEERAGKTLREQHSAAGWPMGLRVGFDAATRARLVEAYGEAALSEAVTRLAARLPAGASADILVAYGPFDLGSMTSRGADGRVRLTIGAPGRSREFALDTALDAAWEAARR
ncbi:MAG: hypothetical protein AAB320_00235 [Elusimicrobiota bacterium]